MCTLGTQAQTWVQKASVPTSARYWAAATGNSTKGYAGTGVLSFELFTSQQQDMYEYDPVTDVWTPLPNYPGGVRQGMTGFTIGERIFFGFGSPFIQGDNQLFEYLPLSGQWATRSSCPLGTSYQNGFVIGDNFYIGPLGVEGVIYRYTASTDSWTPVAPFPDVYRTAQMVFAAGGKGYMGGGSTGFGNTDMWYSYDPVADAWSETAPLWPNSDQSSATTINGVGYVYNVGGNGNNIHRFDHVQESWEMVGQYGDIRTANGSFFTIGNKGYHVFGQQQQTGGITSMNDLWEFTPGAVSAIQEHATANVQVRNAADGSAWLVGTTAMHAGSTLSVRDVAGRLLHTRTLAAGVPLNVRLTAQELGEGLRIVSVLGAQNWTGRVVLAQ